MVEVVQMMTTGIPDVMPCVAGDQHPCVAGDQQQSKQAAVPTERLPELTGLWAVTVSDDRSYFYRFRQAPDGTSFEGVLIGQGEVQNGRILPGGRVEWSMDGKLFSGQLDPTGWCIRDGSVLCHEEEDKQQGVNFTAMRQRECSPEDFEGLGESGSADGRASYQDWADGLFFSVDRDGKEQLLDADGVQVMMEWEKAYMEHCADKLNVTSDCDVLEVGFGCGYSADRIQRKQPRSHTIIECSEIVLERLRFWAQDKPNVKIVQGTWQRMLPSLGLFDKIFFDDYGEPGRSDSEMVENCPDKEYIEVYERSKSHFHAFLNIVLRWHSRAGTQISGYLVSPIEVRRHDVEIDYQKFKVSPPAHCNYFFADTAVVPIFEKKGRRRTISDASGGTSSTRSRSGSDTRSRSRSRGRSDQSDFSSE
eukprot:TRINITY_DN36136_c0_g1_i1.p1 TRINITY_DN36136_c0_g1~~TRINITY_DN36136_c0_g1_i1.p1  ORF type:complete len:420 (+),score=64.77 TRINITY_DN36136_c0_g1_i1:76-1335(+)